MDYYHHKSGSKKRKEKIIREESAKRGQKTLSSFFVPGGEHPTNTDYLESDATQQERRDYPSSYNSYISLN